MRSHVKLAFMIFALFALRLFTPAQAHPLDLGYFQVTPDSKTREIQASLEVNPRIIRPPEDPFSASFGKIKIWNDRELCEWGTPHVEWVSDQQVKVSAKANCAHPFQSKLRINFQLLADLPRTFQILGKNLGAGGSVRSFLAEKQNSEITIAVDTAADRGLGQFVGMGMKHIGAAPSEWQEKGKFHFPDGIDHILFIIALMLGGGSFLTLLKTATGFTLGHSVTLALASLKLVTLPGRFVESAIALSIVYVAGEAFFVTDSRHRFRIATLFGLVHGFGFAAALQELALPRSKMLEALVGFNLGVEFGQIGILAILVPPLYYFSKKVGFAPTVIRVFALGIAAVGAYWFFVRAFGFSE